MRLQPKPVRWKRMGMMGYPLSPLELLHPDGHAERAQILGSGCPERLVPARLEPPGEGLDLIIVAPTAGELTRGWLENATRSVARALDAEGVIYLLLPRSRRFQARRVLSRHGLTVEAWMAHLPDWPTSRYLIPLAAGPASYALSSMIPVRPWRRRVALAGLTPSGGPLVAYGISAAGIVARLPGARPLFEWLFQLDDTEPFGPAAIVTAGRHGDGRSFVVHRLSADGRRPTAVAKLRVSTGRGEGPSDEAELLKRVAAEARAVGADTPEPLVIESSDGRSLLLETPIGGRSAAVILGDAPHRLPEFHDHIAGWLERWNGSTVVKRSFDEARLVDDIIAPARLLAPLVRDGEDYVAWLTARTAELRGSDAPFVATHNDLTMSNLLLTDSGRLGIVDWEASSHDGFPLVDFLYAAADAAAAVHRYDDRVQAFLDCFSDEGRHAGQVRLLNARIAEALELEPALQELCFHACWLHHAANEHRSSRPGEPRPFLEILRWVARRELDRRR